MKKNWTIKNGTLYRQSHNHDSNGYAVGKVDHITEEQIEAFVAVANKEQTIKLKIAKAKELIATLPRCCPTCGHKLSKPKTATEKAASASRANGAKGGRPRKSKE